MSELKINVDNDIRDLLFGVRRSTRYHARRCRFYDSVSSLCKFLSVLGGTATITAVLAKFGAEWTIGFASIVTLFSVLDFVVGSAQKARLHNDFAKQFIDIEKDIILRDPISEGDLRAFTARRLDIEAQEPPPLRVLNMICHNELCRALGYDESQQVKIKWYQRLFCQIIDLSDYRISAPKCS